MHLSLPGLMRSSLLAVVAPRACNPTGILCRIVAPGRGGGPAAAVCECRHRQGRHDTGASRGDGATPCAVRAVSTEKCLLSERQAGMRSAQLRALAVSPCLFVRQCYRRRVPLHAWWHGKGPGLSVVNVGAGLPVEESPGPPQRRASPRGTCPSPAGVGAELCTRPAAALECHATRPTILRICCCWQHACTGRCDDSVDSEWQ